MEDSGIWGPGTSKTKGRENLPLGLYIPRSDLRTDFSPNWTVQKAATETPDSRL